MGQTYQRTMTPAAVADQGASWTNPDNGRVEDSISTTATVTTTTPTSELWFTGLGMALPADAVLAGLAVRCRGLGRVTNLPTLHLQILSAGAKVGTAKTRNISSGAVTWQRVPVTGDTDVWGTTLTVANLNASTFGVALWYTLAAGADFGCMVDAMEIIAYYTSASQDALSTLPIRRPRPERKL